MTEEKNGAVAFFDVDGTLVWHDPERLRRGENLSEDAPTAAVYEAFRRMRDAGHLTFVCTGRPTSLIPEAIRALEPTGLIAAAGAYVRVGDEVVRDERIPAELALEVARRCEDAGVDVNLESNERSVELLPSGKPAHFPSSLLLRRADELAEVLGEMSFSKFCVSGYGLDDLAPLLPFLREHFTVADLQGGTFEFSLCDVDKGTGIEAALAHLGHGRDRTFAFGDSENDLPMLDAVETFVAMGNALPAVLERADYVTLSAEDDGVPAALERFGLI